MEKNVHNLEKLPFLPVKITDKQWADKLQEGQIFMRSLYEYGSWSAIERSKNADEKMKHNIQADIGEGIVKLIDPKVGDSFTRLLPDDLKSHIKNFFYIDQQLYPYFKVFCMYGLTYLPHKKAFEKPDERLKEFGDTAVIFYNPDEFLQRIMEGMRKQFKDDFSFKLDEIKYYPPNYYGPLDEFCKSASYAWQNEIRIRVALLDGKKTKFCQDRKLRKQLIQSTEPIIVDIGNIENISVQIPTQDLINLNLPDFISYKPQK